MSKDPTADLRHLINPLNLKLPGGIEAEIKTDEDLRLFQSFLTQNSDLHDALMQAIQPFVAAANSGSAVEVTRGIRSMPGEKLRTLIMLLDDLAVQGRVEDTQRPHDQEGRQSPPRFLRAGAGERLDDAFTSAPRSATAR